MYHYIKIKPSRRIMNTQHFLRTTPYYTILCTLLLSGHAHAQLRNWAGNHYYTPHVLEKPTTKQELISCITHAAQSNHKICIVGANHSFNRIACADDYCINTRNLSRVLSVDRERMQVRAEGGILMKTFNEHIAQHGLALPNLPAIGGMTLAGAVCTATHGTGKTGTLSDFITEIELITADGIVHTLSAQTTPEAFKAACVSLGTLGVIYSVTLQCVPLFMLEYIQETMHIDDIIQQYKQLLTTHDFFQCRWNIPTGSVQTDVWNRRDVQSHTSQTSIQQLQTSYEALQWDTSTDLGMSSEIALPVDSFAHAVAIITRLADLWSTQGVIISDAVFRFVAADKNSYLSPAADRDVVFVNIGTPVEEKYYGFFRQLEEALYALQGRPHWGKINFLTHDSAFALYGQNLLDFIKIKHQLDPQNVFSNAYTNKILGLQ
jgi:FAD/FMN-containing dehydrogenase